MSATLTGPALSISGSDPLAEPPPPPPTNASNDPADQASGVPPEIGVAEQSALADAKTGKDQAKPEVKADEPKTEEQATDDALKSDKTPPWMKAEITKERNKQRAAAAAQAAAEEKAVAAEKRLNDALEALKAREAPKEEVKPVVEAPRPNRADFETPEAYDAAVDGWATARAEAAADRRAQELEAKAADDKATADREASEAKVAAEMTKLRDDFTQRREKAIETYADYIEVVENDKLTIEVPMAHAALRAENGTEMLYHLGKNPEEAARIAALRPGDQIFEMGKLSATLASRPKVDVSRAPGPITPITSPREGAIDANREESMEEVAARVAKREASGRIGTWGTRH